MADYPTTESINDRKSRNMTLETDNITKERWKVKGTIT